MNYDIALSFAGEDRDYVEQVAEHLRSGGVKVFYDRYEQVDLWGRDLYEHLSDVYQNSARYTVIFISRHYAEKLWTRHERKSAQARALRESEAYILPARFDDTPIPGFPSTVGYLDLRRLSPSQLATAICEKLNLSKNLPEPDQSQPSSEKRSVYWLVGFFITGIILLGVLTALILMARPATHPTKPDEAGSRISGEVDPFTAYHLAQANHPGRKGTTPWFDLGQYCAMYTGLDDTTSTEGKSLYEFESGSPEMADSLANFLQMYEHRIVFLEMDLCVNNVMGTQYVPDGVDLSIGFVGPVIEFVDKDKGDISVTPHSNGYLSIKGYFKVLGFVFTPQDQRISVSLAPVPIETVTPIQGDTGR